MGACSTPSRVCPVRGLSVIRRVIDIVYATVLSVVYALILLSLNYAYGLLSLLFSILPGISGVLTGLFVLGGPLGGIIVRKPGAAVFVSTLGALIESTLGVQWGWLNLLYGFAQGLAAETIFLICCYRIYTPFIAILSGLSAVSSGLFVEIILAALLEHTSLYIVIYVSTSLISGAAIGIFSWKIYLALKKSGALDPLDTFK
ncbi:unknown [Tropheryma whipplei str. Twist]|uniref:Uncharacterized protein n=1 Tax=Tropheryma whipplei (strain Twist) TaxID=203267 RepID=Q83GA4_TROWT|nr:unknown [Tropheryma whipplei str. Twist]